MSGNHFVQTTANQRPFWLLDQINGLPAADFRAGQVLNMNKNGDQIWTPNVDEEFEITVLFQADVANTQQHIFALRRDTAFAADWLLRTLSPANLEFVYRNSSDVSTTLTIEASYTPGAWELVRAIKQGAALSIELNGTEVASSASARTKVFQTGQGNAPPSVGARNDVLFPFNGRVADVWASRTALSAEDREIHDQMYRDTYGLTIA